MDFIIQNFQEFLTYTGFANATAGNLIMILVGSRLHLARHQEGLRATASGAHRSGHHPGQHPLPRRCRTRNWSLRRQLGAQHLLSGSKTRLVSPTRLPRHRSHDRLLGIDFQSEVDSHRSRSPVWHLRSLHDSLGFRLRAQPGSRHRHHRRCRRTYSHLPVEQAQS